MSAKIKASQSQTSRCAKRRSTKNSRAATLASALSLKARRHHRGTSLPHCPRAFSARAFAPFSRLVILFAGDRELRRGRREAVAFVVREVHARRDVGELRESRRRGYFVVNGDTTYGAVHRWWNEPD